MTQSTHRAPSAPTAIHVEDLSHHFGQRQVLNSLTLDIEGGEFLVILGRSGCGKSTLLRLIAGLMEPKGGTIAFSPSRPEIGFVFQDASLLPWRTSLENVTLPLELAGRSGETANTEARALLGAVGLQEFEQYYPEALSGGMRMRVSIARALIGAPGLLLLDEPFGALDELTRRRLDDHLRQLTKARGITTVMVTHSIDEALRLADRVLVLDREAQRNPVPLRLSAGRSTEDEQRLEQLLRSLRFEDTADASEIPCVH